MVNTLYSKIEQELRQALEGEVHFEKEYRLLYATDSSNYRQLPIGVILPKNKQDIIKTVKYCNKYQLPLLTRGGGTSLAGQCCNEGLIMDFSKYYNQVLDIDTKNKKIRVQTGMVLDELNKILQPHHLIFGPDPATHNHCTIGGMMGNNSCGVHSVMAAMDTGKARTSDFVESMEVLTYSGKVMEVGETPAGKLQDTVEANDEKSKILKQLLHIQEEYQEEIRYEYPPIPRRVSGYNLDELLPENNFHVAKALVGSESTCVIFLEATLSLIDLPKAKSLLLLGYPSVFEAGDHVPEILKSRPIALEGMDEKLVNYMHKRGLHEEDLKLLPNGKGWLLVEFGGDTKEEADKQAKKLMKSLEENAEKDPPAMKLYDDQQEESEIWEIRESGLGATAFVKGLPDMWPGWEDSAVPPHRVGDYLRELKKLFHKYDYHPSVYGHFGQGCIHCRIGFDLKTHKGIKKYKQFTQEAAALEVRYPVNMEMDNLGDPCCLPCSVQEYLMPFGHSKMFGILMGK